MSSGDATLCRMTASHWKEDQMMPTYFVCQKARKGYYRSLKEALQHVPPYSRIEISGGGVFHERIVVDKPVEICVAKASDPPVLVYKSTPLTLQTDEAFIEGLTVEVDTGVPAVSILRGSPVLRWCSLQGVEVSGTASPTVQDSKVVEGKTHGIYLLDRASGNYTKNTIYGHVGYSILVEAAGSATVFSYNTVSESKQGHVCVRGGDTDGTVAPQFLLNRFSDDLASVNVGGKDPVGGVLPAYKLEALPVKEQGMQVNLMPVDAAADVTGVAADDDAAEDPLLHSTSTKCAVLIAGARAQPTFTRNSINSCQMHGLYLRSGCGGEFDGNYMTNNKGWGILIEGEKTSTKLSGNHVSSNGGGARVSGSPVKLSGNNTLVGNRGIQLYVENCHEEFVCERNTFKAANKVGVWVIGPGAGLFTRNDFDSCATGLRIEGGAGPTVQGCAFDACSVGVYALAEGAGTLSECSFTDMSVAGAVIATQASPSFVLSTFTTSTNGVKVVFGGRGLLDRCLIKEFRGHGVEVYEGGDPEVRLTEIRQGYDDGVRVALGGRGRFVSNLIVGCSGAQVRVSDRGHPLLSKNVIGHSASDGIVVEDGGYGEYTGNIVRFCHNAGIVVGDEATAPSIVGNYIHKCGSYGLHITAAINGTYEGNVITGCGRANVSVAGKALGGTTRRHASETTRTPRGSTRANSSESSAPPPPPVAVPSRTALVLRGNIIRGSLWSGVVVERRAKVLLTGNTIADNVQGVTSRGGSRLLVVANDFARCQHGVCADEDVLADVLGNYFHAITRTAVCSLSTERCQVQWNIFHTCGTAIMLRRVLTGSCCENTIRSSRLYGIFLGIDCRATVFRNSVYDCRVGIGFGELSSRAEVYDNTILNAYEDAIRVSGEKMDAVSCYSNTICSSNTGVMLRAGNARLRYNMVLNCREGIRISNGMAEGGGGAGGAAVSAAFSVAGAGLNSTVRTLAGMVSARSTTARSTKAKQQQPPLVAASTQSQSNFNNNTMDSTVSADGGTLNNTTSGRGGGANGAASTACAAVAQYCYISCCSIGGITTLPCTATVSDTLLCNNDIGFQATGKDAAVVLRNCVVCNSAAVGILCTDNAAGSVSSTVLFKNFINAVAVEGCTTTWTTAVLEAPVVFNCFVSGAGSRPHFTSCLLTARATATREASGSKEKAQLTANTEALAEQLQRIIAYATKGPAATGNSKPQVTAPGQRSVLFKINDAIAAADTLNSAQGGRFNGRLVSLAAERAAALAAVPSLWDDRYEEPASWGDKGAAGSADYTALAESAGITLPGGAPGGGGGEGGGHIAVSAAVDKHLERMDRLPFPCNRRRSAILWPANQHGAGTLGGPGGPFLQHRTLTSGAAASASSSSAPARGAPGQGFSSAAGGGGRHRNESLDDDAAAAAARSALCRDGYAFVCSGVWIEKEADPTFERSYLGEHIYMGNSGDRRLGPDTGEEWIFNPLLPYYRNTPATSAGGAGAGKKTGSGGGGIHALDADALSTEETSKRLYVSPLGQLNNTDTLLGQLLRAGSPSLWRQYSTGASFFARCCPLLDERLEPGALRVRRSRRSGGGGGGGGREGEVDPELVDAHVSTAMTEHIAGYGVLATDGAVGQFANCVFGRNARGVRLGRRSRTAFKGCRFEGHTGSAAEFLDGSMGVVQNCIFRDSRYHQVLVRDAHTVPTIDNNTFNESPFTAITCTQLSAPIVSGNRLRLIHTNAIIVEGGAHPQLERNRVEACKCGLLVQTGGRGYVMRNSFIDNTEVAVLIQDNGTAPRLVENNIHNSKSVGLCVSGAGACPIVRNNSLVSNVSGIVVKGGAGGVYVSNSLRAHETGILIEDSAGECRANKVVASVVVGIKVTGTQSSPVVAENSITDGERVGLHVVNSLGVFSRNRIADNKTDGCVLEGSTAQPLLLSNFIFGNAGSGAHLCLGCRPSLCANVFSRNQGGGLTVADANTRPALEGDVFKGNRVAGIAFTNKCGGLVNGAVLSGTEGGPAVVVSGDAEPALQECLFIDNDAGGLHVMKDGLCTTSRCVFANNTTAPAYTHAGREPGSRVAACVFAENHTSLLCDSEGRVEVTGTAFLGAHASGAAVRVQREGSPSLSFCLFAGVRSGALDMGVARYNRCIFVDCQCGVDVAGSSSLYECEMRECPIGVRVSRGMPTIMGCLFSGCARVGAQVSEEGQPSLSECGILRCGKGVVADGNSSGSATDNRILWNNDNVLITENASLDLNTNFIYDAGNIGVHVKGGRPSIVGNEIFDNYFAGVLVEAVSGGRLEDNRISFAREDGCLVFRDAASKKDMSTNGNALHNSYSPPPNTQFKHVNDRQQMYRKLENEKEKGVPSVVEQRRFAEEVALVTLLRVSTLAARGIGGAAEKDWLAFDGPADGGTAKANNKGKADAAAVATAADSDGAPAPATASEEHAVDEQEAKRKAALQREQVLNNFEEPMRVKWDRLPAEAAQAAARIYTPHSVPCSAFSEAAPSPTAAAAPTPAAADTAEEEAGAGGTPRAGEDGEELAGSLSVPFRESPVDVHSPRAQLVDGLPPAVEFVLFNRTKRRVLAVLEGLQCATNPGLITVEAVLNRPPLMTLSGFLAASDDALLRAPQRQELSKVELGAQTLSPSPNERVLSSGAVPALQLKKASTRGKRTSSVGRRASSVINAATARKKSSVVQRRRSSTVSGAAKRGGGGKKAAASPSKKKKAAKA